MSTPHPTTQHAQIPSDTPGVMTRRQGAYLNIAVTVLTGVLALNVLGTREPSAMPQAFAAPPSNPTDVGEDTISGRISAAEQRKQIISELKSLNQKLERIDAQVKGGLTVKVTDMPADKQAKSEPKARPEGKPEPRVEVRPATTKSP